MLGDLIKRPRRLRRNASVRELVRDTHVQLSHLIQPYFLKDGKGSEPITGFSGVCRLGVDLVSRQVESDLEKGLRNFLFFAHSTKKDSQGTEAWNPEGLIPTTLSTIKKRFGDSVLLFTDVCLCPFTSHGHCGVVKGEEIVNDASVEQLAKMAVCHAQAGADFVAPSDMMDGRVRAIRHALDRQGYQQVGVLAYTAKYASSYYGPFREALDSSPQFSDRSSYQMDFRNARAALQELSLDLEEGADIVMVKPALPYLDIIAQFREHSAVPVAAYCVSAEYQMVKLLVREGLAEERKLVLENLSAITRAGAQIIVTYHASEIARGGWL
ncbi:MAG: porphobilinogen synthase [Deltaproteobacteria bacterium]|nr:porphobilinogen synthase [Deltaproteobacteria bacterium]